MIFVSKNKYKFKSSKIKMSKIKILIQENIIFK